VKNLSTSAFDTGEQNLRGLMNAYERQLILSVLERHQWRRSEVARRLGIDRKTLFTKIKQLNIEKKV
jgi:two-component system response regulator AtoC